MNDSITGEPLFGIKDLGLDLAVLGAIISSAGVFANNILLNHTLAMQIWVPSNAIFVLYFFGRWRDWWDGGISNAVMCAMYVMMLVSGVIGLMQ